MITVFSFIFYWIVEWNACAYGMEQIVSAWIGWMGRFVVWCWRASHLSAAERYMKATSMQRKGRAGAQGSDGDNLFILFIDFFLLHIYHSYVMMF